MARAVLFICLSTLFAGSVTAGPVFSGSFDAAAVFHTEDLEALHGLLHRRQSAGVFSNRNLLQLSSSKGEELIGYVRAGDLSGVKRLLSDGVDPNFESRLGGQTPLLVAVREDFGEAVTLLLAEGASTTSGGLGRVGVLQSAAYLGSLDAAKALLEAGFGPDSLNSDGFSPLHYSALQGFVGMGALLLDNGATVDFLTDDSDTPLMIAASNSHLGMVKLLIDRGANVNQRKYPAGFTALFAAAGADSGIIIQELVSSGADVNAQTSTGLTPLFLSALLGNQVALEVLLLNGADKSLESNDVSAREAVCGCLVVRSLEDQCNLSACSRPEKMRQLLE